MKSISLKGMIILSEPVTIKLIAQLAGVSRSTVSRVMNNPELVKPETVAKVQRVVQDLNYRPSAVAQSMRFGQTHTIGIIISNIANPFLGSIVHSIENTATERGVSVIVCSTDEDKRKELDYIKKLIDHRVDGIIIASTGYIANYHKLVRNTPLVFIDRSPGQSDYDLYDCIQVNNDQGSYDATTELIRKGATKIGAIIGDAPTTGDQRLIGFQRALRDHHQEYSDADVVLDSYLGTHASEGVQTLLDSGHDAIFCGNNIILDKVLRFLKQYPNKNIRVAVFDDQDWYDLAFLPIVSISQPVDAIGNGAMNLLLNKLDNMDREPVHEILETKLIVR